MLSLNTNTDTANPNVVAVKHGVAARKVNMGQGMRKRALGWDQVFPKNDDLKF